MTNETEVKNDTVETKENGPAINHSDALTYAGGAAGVGATVGAVVGKAIAPETAGKVADEVYKTMKNEGDKMTKGLFSALGVDKILPGFFAGQATEHVARKASHAAYNEAIDAAGTEGAFIGGVIAGGTTIAICETINLIGWAYNKYTGSAEQPEEVPGPDMTEEEANAIMNEFVDLGDNTQEEVKESTTQPTHRRSASM